MKKFLTALAITAGAVVLLVAACGTAAHADAPDPDPADLPPISITLSVTPIYCPDGQLPEGYLVCLPPSVSSAVRPDLLASDPGPPPTPNPPELVLIWPAQPDHDLAPALRYCAQGGPTYPTSDGCALVAAAASIVIHATHASRRPVATLQRPVVARALTLRLGWQ